MLIKGCGESGKWRKQNAIKGNLIKVSFVAPCFLHLTELGNYHLDLVFIVLLPLDLDLVLLPLDLDFIVLLPLDLDFIVLLPLNLDFIVTLPLDLDFIVLLSLDLYFIVLLPLNLDFIVLLPLDLDGKFCPFLSTWFSMTWNTRRKQMSLVFGQSVFKLTWTDGLWKSQVAQIITFSSF